MESIITAFIHSQTGQIVAITLTAVGVTDLGVIFYVTKFRPELIPPSLHQQPRFVIALSFIAAFLALLGGYMLFLRA